MPYRRLPNTDQARIRAIEQAVEQEMLHSKVDLAITYKIINDAKSFLIQFKKAQSTYAQSWDGQVSASKKYREQSRIARMYVSHFLQVLNMCVQRREIKAEFKELYGLNPHSQTIPDISSDAALVKWGQLVIDGEAKRIAQRGSPIYNPTIGKVSVYYDIFREAYFNQKNFQKSTLRTQEQLAGMREQADDIILEIWNQLEDYFKDYPASEKILKCQEYGVKYYYRRNEIEKEKNDRLQTSFDFEE